MYDFYGGDSNYLGEKRSYETPDNESRPRESYEDDDVYGGIQADAEAAENEEDNEPIKHFIFKRGLMDAKHRGARADPGNGIKFAYSLKLPHLFEHLPLPLYII